MKTIDEGMTSSYNQEDWIPLTEASWILDISQWTLYTLVRNKKIDSMRIGHRIFVREQSVVDYIKMRELVKKEKQSGEKDIPYGR